MSIEQSNILKNSIRFRINEGKTNNKIAKELDCSLRLVRDVREGMGGDSDFEPLTPYSRRKIRGMATKGMNTVQICAETGLSEQTVRNILNGRRVASGRKPQKNRTGHYVFEAWAGKAAPVPRGKCVAWIVTDGKAHQCGALCKGQRCKDHPQGVAQTIRIGARNGGGLAA